MKRAMTYVAVWGGATTMAMLLVWFGARPVLHNAVFGEPPAARQVIARPSTAVAPSAVPTPAPSATSGESSTIATPSPEDSTPVGEDHVYVIHGGRVVLSMSDKTVKLVSATPDPGYEVRTWHSVGWMRVDFVRSHRVSSLFVTWNGHRPVVQYEDPFGGE